MPNIKNYIDKNFLNSLLSNLQSSDCEERFLVKLLIHKLYGVSIFFRTSLLVLIENKFLDMAFGSERPADLVGVIELLELLSI